MRPDTGPADAVVRADIAENGPPVGTATGIEAVVLAGLSSRELGSTSSTVLIRKRERVEFERPEAFITRSTSLDRLPKALAWLTSVGALNWSLVDNARKYARN